MPSQTAASYQGIMFEYQERHRFFAQTPGGMEKLAALELSELGAADIRTAYRGLRFEAPMETLYRINYRARLLTRVLAPLKTFHCHNTEYLYRQVKKLDWSSIFTPNHAFAVFSTISHSAIKHSRYAALCVKDGIADHFRERFNSRPGVRKEDPDLWVNLHIEHNLATISLDTSGGSLHRRGYREQTVEAPMQEILAAAIVRIIAWDGHKKLWDPFCGSGTLLAEALMDYCRIPAGFLRNRFGFERLPDFDRTLWRRIQEEEKQQIRALPENLLVGSDASPAAVKSARVNLQRLPSGNKIALSVADFRNIPSLEGTVVMGNPPHGVRLREGMDTYKFYKDLGDFFKQRCKGSSVYLYVGSRGLIPLIGLKPTWKKALASGGLDGRLVRFEMY
jgi:putative N6-adenine-specific DNA methylase